MFKPQMRTYPIVVVTLALQAYRPPRQISSTAHQALLRISIQAKGRGQKQRRKKPNVATNLLAFFLFCSTIITSLHIPRLTKFVDYKVFKYGMSRISTRGVCYIYWPLALLDFIPLFMRNFTRGVLCLKFVQSFNFYYLILLCLDIDECNDGSHDCRDAANCKNTAGSFDCSCQSGHLKDGRYFCLGISLFLTEHEILFR